MEVLHLSCLALMSFPRSVKKKCNTDTYTHEQSRIPLLYSFFKKVFFKGSLSVRLLMKDVFAFAPPEGQSHSPYRENK